MIKRGVIYLNWGPNRGLLDRSLESLRAFHPNLPVEVVRLPDSATLLDKATMMNVSPFEETLFLDADTVVLGRLDFGFEKALRHGLACCICEMPWARRYPSFSGDEVEYNTGVLFFTRQVREVFARWEALSRQVESRFDFWRDGKLLHMPVNDQASFAKAIHDLEFNPFVLPCNWNFRPVWQVAWWGPIKIWHHNEYPSESVLEFVRQQNEPKAVLEYRRFT